MLRLAVALALLLPSLTATPVLAGGSGPVFHGYLDVAPVSGRITKLDPVTGNLTVRNWLFLPIPGSNGFFPGTEDLIVAIGDNNKFTIPGGLVKGNSKATRFTYRTQMKSGTSGIQSVRIVKKPDDGPLRGWYSVQFKLRNIDIDDLYDQDPVCLSMAFIVGDDDGFSGIQLSRKSFQSKRFRIRGACDPSGVWPWL